MTVLFPGVFVLLIFLIWKPFEAWTRRNIMLSIAGVMLVSIILPTGIDMYRDSVPEITENVSEVSLDEYRPFTYNTRAKDLGAEASVTFETDLPRIDGATALYPLYSAFVRATYPEKNYDPYGKDIHTAIVVCSSTSGAINNLLNGDADVIFVMGISEKTRTRAEELGLTLKLTPIGKEAFVFIVNEHNTMDNLTVQNIRDIYSGKVKNWHGVGGGFASIRAYQRPDESGSQTALKELMGDIPIMPAPQKGVVGLMHMLYKTVADYQNYRNSLGYSFRFYLTDMLDGGVKLLSIDGVAPNEETIANGEYPLTNPFYAVTVEREPPDQAEKRRAENTGKLIDWILSEQGQYLVKETGYVPIN